VVVVVVGGTTTSAVPIGFGLASPYVFQTSTANVPAKTRTKMKATVARTSNPRNAQYNEIHPATLAAPPHKTHPAMSDEMRTKKTKTQRAAIKMKLVKFLQFNHESLLSTKIKAKIIATAPTKKRMAKRKK